MGALAQGLPVRRAVKVAGVHETTVFQLRNHDEAFRAAWAEAAEIGTELLEQEAQRRAYHGVLKPVYQKGVRVGYERRYSDTLLMFILKKRVPAYRDGGGSVTINNDVRTVNVFADIERDAGIIAGRVDAAPVRDLSADGVAQPLDAAQPGNAEAQPEAD
jgi:hypothetical protein